MRAILVGLRRELGRDLALVELACPGVSSSQYDRLHLDEIDDAVERVLGADRQLQRHRLARFEALPDLREHAEEVRAGAIHLVDEGEARHAVLVRLAPDRLGLRLDAADRAEHRDGAVEHAQRALAPRS